MPLHPALVHLPLGLAIVVPIVALALAWAVARNRLPLRAWALVVALQGVVALGALAALSTGERDEDRVERVVGEAPIERHEGAAKTFAIAAFVGLALAGVGLVPKDKLGRTARVATALGTLGVLMLGVRVGHSGGELVYEKGAAAAHASPNAGANANPAVQSHDDDGD